MDIPGKDPWSIMPDTKLPGLGADPTVPSGIGRIGARRRGDLMVIRQQLDRYEDREIAHIENVLQGENHERSFARTQTTEETLSRTEDRLISEERDLQSTERFEMNSEMKELVKDSLKLEAGVSVSASYGPTVGVEASTQFGVDHAQEKSKQAASQYARELTSRAQTRIETRIVEQRVTRVVQEVRELTRHGIDNAKGAAHVRGIYRWVNKVYRAQVVNYGIRDLYDFMIPEPSAFWRFLEAGTPLADVTLTEPSPPSFKPDDGDRRPLRPRDLVSGNYNRYVAGYQATDVAPPPAPVKFVSHVFEKGGSVNDEAWGPSTKVVAELTIPAEYEAKWVRIDGRGVKLEDEDGWWRLEMLGQGWDRNDADDFVAISARNGTIPMGLTSNDYWTLVVGVEFKCELAPAALQAWQLATYAAIMAGYEKQRLAYEEQVQAARANRGVEISGRNPSANERLIREELKKAALTILTGQRFDDFDAMRPAGQKHGYPEMALKDAAAEGRYVGFWEQAFEWENMTFVFYPYFWGNKSNWPFVARLDDTDPLFAAFLRAGFARVQVPVRPGLEGLVDYTFAPENWQGNAWVGDDPPGFDRDGALSIEEEMLFQTGGATFVQGPGFVTTVAGSDIVTGSGTAFSADDIDRELRVAGVDYRIIDVVDETHVRVGPVAPKTDSPSVQYALGAKLVGQPWEIVVPTTLVYLQSDAALNRP
jgi:hypothetical protein